MHRTYTLLVFLVISTGCHGFIAYFDPIEGGSDATGDDASIEAQGLQGAQLFQTWCSSCHGPDGSGTSIFPTSIQGFEPIDQIVLDGRGTMSAIPLEPEEVELIQAFLVSLAAPTETLDGAGLYGRYCASCHGADASGGPNWEGSIQGYEPIADIVARGKGGMEPVPIGAEETARIQAWLSTLAPPKADLDGAGLFNRYCSTCHGADATGGTDWSGSIQAYEPIETIVLEGRGEMAPIPITIDDVAQIQAFLLLLATPTDQLDGAQVYERYCSTCHGPDANGGAQWPGSIAAYEPIDGIVTNGRGDMPPVPIDAAAIARVQAWLLGLATPTAQLDGAGVYARYCSTCHGADATGGTEWTGSIAAYEPIDSIVLEGRGLMDPVPLTAADVAKVQAYLLTLAAPTSQLDGPGVYARYCSTCHGADATGGTDWSGSIQGYEPIEPIVLNGRGAMAPIAITTADVARVQDWLSTLGTPTAQLDGPGLYDRYCSTCHGADATGGTDWTGSIQGYEPIDAIVTNGRGTMSAVAVDAGQIAQIQAFLLTLAPPLSSLSGPEVYDRLCVSCHGDRGEGTATTGMQLRYDDDPFSRYWVRNGRTSSAFASDMPAYPASMISDQQLDEMFTWINQVPHPTSGQGLFVQYCANCHGATGSGGPSGKNIRNEGGSGVIRNGKGGSNYGARRDYMSSWNTAQLSASEVSAILSYTQGL